MTKKELIEALSPFPDDMEVEYNDNEYSSTNPIDEVKLYEYEFQNYKTNKFEIKQIILLSE